MTFSDHPHSTLFWAGCIGAALAAFFGLLGPHEASLWRAEGTLQRHVEAALRIAQMPGLEVDMDGQKARLYGVLPDSEAIEEASRIARRAAGAGGAWAGGVTSVDTSGLSEGPMRSPYQWRIRKQGREVVLSGSVPSERARAALMRAAAGAFPNADAPVDEMELAGGAPAANWLEVARDAVTELGRLDGGEARLVDTRLVFIGTGAEAAEAALRARYEEPPAPFEVRVDVIEPEGGGILQGLGDAASCDLAFGQLMSRNSINFPTGSDAIDPESSALLDQLASVALRCDGFDIQVFGHTDNEGARASNMALSRARAEAVVAYLQSQGVARDRLSAEGFGPDRPVASNATLEGRAANRRIEFNVGT